MFHYLFIFLVVSFGFMTPSEAERGRGFCNPCVLEDKIPRTYARYQSFFDALELMNKRHPLIIVDTENTLNSQDGNSMLIFEHWAKIHTSKIYSLHRETESLRGKLFYRNSPVELISYEAVEFLENFRETIDVLYVDSADYDAENPEISQQYQLKKVMAAYPRLSQKSLVIIDHSNLEKSKPAIEFLLNRGWKMIIQGYVMVLSL